MAFLTQRFIQAACKRPATIRAGQEFAEPDLVVLPVRPGFAASEKPPVRIFLGTEAAQYKAERIFIWSIEQVRDPSRVYEIHLMKHLRGFRSRFWLTGFTNYRFAIPHFAGGRGRAIYNDVDQIYLKDPAELFDLEMGEHAYLAIDPGDISVALFDCEQMSRIWSLDDARNGRKNELLARASAVPGQWGQLARSWNARDREFASGESGVLHYTALHRQPWYPFPKLFVYHANEAADIWFDLERSANDAAFRVFSAAQPSQAFKALCRAATEQPGLREAIGYDPLQLLDDEPPGRRDDAVVCTGTLETIPDDDIPWVLERLFSSAARELYCEVRQKSRRPVEWWQYQFELVARHHPGVHWRLRLERDEALLRHRDVVLEGNECSRGNAVVWVLAEKKPGHTSQAVALADRIGWPYRLIQVPMSFKSLLLVMLRINSGRLGELQAPWPNVVVASGWWPARVARWIRRQGGGRVRLVLGGRKCGPVRGPTDILVSCRHFHLPVHERRIETLLPVNRVTRDRLDAARERGIELTATQDGPKVVLLVGGSSKQHVLTEADAALLGRQVLQQVKAIGGALFAVTARRTGSGPVRALTEALRDDAAHLHVWSADEVANPYISYLAAADILVVTGESESMLTDAIATGRPVYIYPIRQRRYGPWLKLGEKLAEWSERRPKNRRGTERPQQGLEYLCSLILKREWILPPRDLDSLHRSLVKIGLARMFGSELTSLQVAAQSVPHDLGQRLRIMLAQAEEDTNVHAGNSLTADITIGA